MAARCRGCWPGVSTCPWCSTRTVPALCEPRGPISASMAALWLMTRQARSCANAMPIGLLLNSVSNSCALAWSAPCAARVLHAGAQQGIAQQRDLANRHMAGQAGRPSRGQLVQRPRHAARHQRRQQQAEQQAAAAGGERGDDGLAVCRVDRRGRHGHAHTPAGHRARPARRHRRRGRRRRWSDARRHGRRAWSAAASRGKAVPAGATAAIE